MEELKKKVPGMLCLYSGGGSNGYSFDIELNRNIKISGTGFESEEAREKAAKDVADILGVSIDLY